MVKLIKKSPGYTKLASVYAYNDDTWIQVAIEATAGPDSTSAGTLVKSKKFCKIVAP